MNAAGLVVLFDSPYDDLYTPYFDLRVTDANDVVYAGGQTGDIVSEVYLPGAGEYFVQVGCLPLLVYRRAIRAVLPAGHSKLRG